MASDRGRPGPRRRGTRSAPAAGRRRSSPASTPTLTTPAIRIPPPHQTGPPAVGRWTAETLTPARRNPLPPYRRWFRVINTAHGVLPGAWWDRSRQSLTGGSGDAG